MATGLSSALPKVIRLPADATSVAAARDFVTTCLTKWSVAEAADDIGLVVDELVTNAIKHARSPVTVSIAHRADRIIVNVEDESTDDPRPDMLAGPMDEEGRGLRLVSHMAREWGSTRLPDGKRVWAEISLDSAE
jgi:anti-sigma regulatory factor (Ser/Thr protein kinase)